MHTFWAALGRLLWRIRRFFHPHVTTFLPGYEGYGGATITRRVDGAGAEWIACCARQQSDGYFGFFAFKNGANVPIAPRCSGRGSIDDGWWIAWEGSTPHKGSLPGWTTIDSGSDTSALEQQIAQQQQQIATLSQTVASLPPTTTGPTIRVPAQAATEGGEIQLAAGDGGGPWCIDVVGGTLRFHRDGTVYERWPH